MPPKLIVTSANTGLIRLWSLFGDVLCVFNIEHPLPYRWRIKVSNYHKRKAQFTEAKNLLDEIEHDKEEDSSTTSYRPPAIASIETDTETKRVKQERMTHHKFFEDKSKTMTFA